MNKIFKNFLFFSGFLFWLIVISVFLPSDFMGSIGLIGVYMMMFGFPFLFFVLIVIILILGFIQIVNYKNYRDYVKNKHSDRLEK